MTNYIGIGRIDTVSSFMAVIMEYLIPFIGVPRSQFKLNTDPTHVGKVLKRVLLTGWKDNYFYAPYTENGEWNDECCPIYLKEEYYEKLQGILREDKLRIVTNKMDEIESDVKFNRIILLDHMDWMHDEDIITEFNNLKKIATKDCLYCWRSFSYEQPFACLRHLDYKVSERLFDEEQRPNRFGDRVSMYNSIHVASVPENYYDDEEMSLSQIRIPEYELTTKQSLYVFGNMMVQPFLQLGLNNKDFMNTYYKNQAKYYDAYRQNMLHGKKYLMYSIPWNEMKDKNVMLMAGGTGDLMDYFIDWIPDMNKVTVTDISKPMLNVAYERVTKNNLKNVSTRIEDLNDDDDFVEEEENTYDLLLLTYSLTMVPNWAKTIKRALKYLKPGGILAVADFTVTKDQSTLSKLFWKFIFSKSHIHLNENHIRMIQNECETEYLRIDEGDFPHVPYFSCNYYYGLFRKK
jgi:S-adenosylmethionine-diacylgycerolhomoserine-N-methlytransferase